MTIRNTLQVGLLSLCLAAPMYARTHHYVRHDTQVVDVNASALPPPPPTAKHVIVVNSAQNAPRRHGLAGMAQRLHNWHMRERAHLYHNFSK
jgi:hypothetical protein